MSSVPVESVTDLNTCSTAIMGLAGDWVGSDMKGFYFDLRSASTPLYPDRCSRRAGGLYAPGSDGAKACPPKRPQVILVLGDSLSAEYGLPRGTGWVALLEKRLAQERSAPLW
jgi:hypothetical protein